MILSRGTGDLRSVPSHATTPREITDRVEREQERLIKWVFHRDGMKIHSKRFYKQWHDAVERAAYEGEGDLRVVKRPNLVEYEDAKGRRIRPIPHDLRRAAVMAFERAGVPRTVAMSITGHRTESTYTRYGIARAEEQREGLAKVERQFGVNDGQKRKRRSGF